MTDSLLAESDPTSEYKARRERLAEIDALLTNHEETIRRLQLEIKSLRRERRTVKGEAAALHPLKRLPDELLGQIFLACIEDWESEFPTLEICRVHSIELYDSRRVISQVCRKWRSAALGFPRLWSSLYIVIGGSNYPQLISALRHYLPRSGSHPLRIALVAHETLQPPYPPPFLNILLPSSSRWEELYITLSWESLTILAPRQPHLSMLKTLYLAPIGFPPPFGSPGFVDPCLWQRTRLQTFLTASTKLQYWIILWEHITDLRLVVPVNTEEVLQTIKEAKRLERCVLTCLPISRIIGTQPVTLPSLTSLSVPLLISLSPTSTQSETEDFSSGSILQYIRAPKLESLKLTNLLNLQHLTDFIQNSNIQSSLRRLQLIWDRVGWMTDAQCLDLLRSLDSLELLVIGGGRIFTPWFVSELSVTEGSDKGPPCPTLRKLQIISDEKLDRHLIGTLTACRPTLSVSRKKAR